MGGVRGCDTLHAPMPLPCRHAMLCRRCCQTQGRKGWDTTHNGWPARPPPRATIPAVFNSCVCVKNQNRTEQQKNPLPFSALLACLRTCRCRWRIFTGCPGRRPHPPVLEGPVFASLSVRPGICPDACPTGIDQCQRDLGRVGDLVHSCTSGMLRCVPETLPPLPSPAQHQPSSETLEAFSEKPFHAAQP